MPMRILLDSRMIEKSGIGRYIQMLVIAMLEEYPHLQIVLAGYPHLNQDFIAKINANLRGRISASVYNAPIYGLTEQLQGRKTVNTHRHLDLLHIPHFNAPWNLPQHSVVTIHDLIPFKCEFPRNQLQVRAGRMVLMNALAKAGRIIVISKATANDLVQDYPRGAWQDKIRVVPQGVSADFRPLPQTQIDAFKAQHHLQRYLLFVGNRASHKNLERLLIAYALLLDRFPGLQLVIVGRRLASPDDVDKAKRKLGLRMVREWEECSDADLLSLYCGAEMLIFPSFYEGFGLPPLEAMACGTPVVVSECASLPEVVGEAGLYFNPLQPTDIASQVSRLLVDSTMRDSLRAKGLVRASAFTWQKTAQQTMTVYEEIARGVRI